MKYRCTYCKETFETLVDGYAHFKKVKHAWGGLEYLKDDFKIPKKIQEEIDHLKKTGIPRCSICLKPMENVIDKKTGKINPYLWKTTCTHANNIYLSRG